MVSIQRMAHKGWLFLLTITLLLPSAIRVEAAIPEAEEIFQKMAESFRTVDYKGRFTFMFRSPNGNQTREATMTRKAPDQIRIDILWPPDERGAVMVMNGNERWHVREERERGRGRGRMRGRRPFLPPNRMGESLLKETRILLKNYDIGVFEGGHVAGRSAYLIEVEANVRPTAKIWVDKETGVILKMEHYDPQRRLKDLLVYSNIDFHPEIDEAVFRKPDGVEADKRPGGREEIWNNSQGKLDLSKIRKAAQLDVVVPEGDLSGFALQSIHIIKFGERKNVQLSYTDGLSMLSVFQSSSDEGRRGEGRGRLFGRRRGGRREGKRQEMSLRRGGRTEKVDIHGTECEIISRGSMSIFRWSHNGVYITLMGELGREEMIKIVGSFIKNGE